MLELSDDGNGVDLEKVRRSIVARQLSPADTAAQLSEEELLTFLFLPGFSLRDTVTEVSGRGVGLDAVQHMVRQLRGAVELQQTADEGSRFHLEVPLTLSVVRSLVVEVGEEASRSRWRTLNACATWSAMTSFRSKVVSISWHEGRHVGLGLPVSC